MKSRKVKMLIFTTTLFILSGCFLFGEYQKEERYKDEQTKLTKTITVYENQARDVQKAAEKLLKDTRKEETDSEDVLNTLEEDIKRKPSTLKSEKNDQFTIFLDKDTKKLPDIEKRKNYIADLKKYIKRITSAMNEVEKSVERKEYNTAREGLSVEYQSAKKTWDESGECIQNSILKKEFENIIKEASAIPGTAKDIKILSERLSAMHKEVKKDISTYLASVKESAEKKESQKKDDMEQASTEIVSAEAPVEPPAEPSPTIEPTTPQEDVAAESDEAEIAIPIEPNIPEEDIWYVSYRVGIHEEIPSNDGSVVKWEEGYFCAHSNFENGQRIGSVPQYVVVDGIKYRYVSSKTVSTDTYWHEISSFVLANGGIGFQTCSGAGLFISHYEPV